MAKIEGSFVKTDEEIAGALEGLGDEKPAGKEEEVVVDDEHPLATEDDDDEVSLGDDEDDDEVSLSDADDPDKKGPPEAIPYKRFKKTIGERNDLRGQVDTLQTQLASSQELISAIQDEYKDFKDPAGQARVDAQFMSALESLVQEGNPDAKRLGEIVVAKMNGETVTELKTAPASAPETDPRLEAIIERDATRTISEALHDVKPTYVKMITDHILGDEDVDLANLSKRDVIAAGKGFLKEYDLTVADVLAGEKPSGDPKKTKPNTGGSQTVSTTVPGKKASGNQDDPKAPTTRDEWDAQRSERVAAVVGSISSDS